MSTKSSNQSAGYERVRHSTDNASSDTLLDREEDQTATWKELRASQGLDFRERQNKTRRHLLLIVCLVQTVLLLVLASLCVHLWLKRGEPRIVIQHDVDVGCGAFPLGTDPSGFVPASELTGPSRCSVASMDADHNQILATPWNGGDMTRVWITFCLLILLTPGRISKSRPQGFGRSTKVWKQSNADIVHLVDEDY